MSAFEDDKFHGGPEPLVLHSHPIIDCIGVSDCKVVKNLIKSCEGCSQNGALLRIISCSRLLDAYRYIVKNPKRCKKLAA